MFVKDIEYLLIQPALVPLAQVRDGDPVLGHGDPGVGGVQGSLVLQPDPPRAQLQPRVHQHLLTVDIRYKIFLGLLDFFPWLFLHKRCFN